MSIHYKFVGDLVEQLAKTEDKLQIAVEELKKAMSYGDLRENSEYDIARSNHLKLLNEKEKILSLLESPVLHSKSNDIIEPGSIILLKVFGPYKEITTDITNESSLRMLSFKDNTIIPETPQPKAQEPNFYGVLLFGGLPDIYDFRIGKTLNVESPIGKFINGKPSGEYTIQVPDGFVNVQVTKLKNLKSTDDALTDTSYSILKFYEEAGISYEEAELQPYYKIKPM